ncbi:hypothetical protein Tco_1021085, partial [Tanacetum coccineum]
SQTELTDLVLKLSKKVEGLETKLKNTKHIYEDEADLPAEDSSKQGRMMEDIDLDVDTSLVQPHAAKVFFTLLLLLRLVLQGRHIVQILALKINLEF